MTDSPTNFKNLQHNFSNYFNLATLQWKNWQHVPPTPHTLVRKYKLSNKAKVRGFSAEVRGTQAGHNRNLSLLKLTLTVKAETNECLTSAGSLEFLHRQVRLEASQLFDDDPKWRRCCRSQNRSRSYARNSWNPWTVSSGAEKILDLPELPGSSCG
jgi:hypothetical protein